MKAEVVLQCQRFVLAQFQKVSIVNKALCVSSRCSHRPACTAVSSHYLSFTPDGIRVARLVFAWSHKHTFKGVPLFEPVAGHLSGRVVGPSGAASIVGEK